MNHTISKIRICLFIIFSISATSYADLVAQWKFNEPSGNIAYDSVGQNDGDIFGANRTSSPLDESLDFNGTDDYIEIDNFDYSVFNTNQISIEAWLKIDAPGGQYSPQHYVLDSRDGGLEAGFGLNVGTELIQFWVGDTVAYESSSIIQPNTWHQVIGSFDGNYYSIYVDGIIMGSVYQPDTIVASVFPMYIGQRYTLDERFDGQIDEIRIYNNAIPEPATLLLIGFGGLFLRRKSR